MKEKKWLNNYTQISWRIELWWRGCNIPHHLKKCLITTSSLPISREYWMIHRGPGFLTVVWFGSTPASSPPSPVRKFDRRHTGRLRKRDSLLLGGGAGSGRGAECPNHTTAGKLGLVIYKSFNTLSPIVYFRWNIALQHPGLISLTQL